MSAFCQYRERILPLIRLGRTLMQEYPESPYFRGRWSNGRVYIEYVAEALNLPLYDYAAAGATTGFAPAQASMSCFALSGWFMR